MATPIWKGHLTFGLVSIPVKLCRAARAEKVGFRQVHEATGTRVRQALYREPEDSLDMPAWGEAQPQVQSAPLPKNSNVRQSEMVIPFPSPPQAVEVSRGELAKGYEYEPGRYVVLSREEMESSPRVRLMRCRSLSSSNWLRSTRPTSKRPTMSHRIEAESEHTLCCSKHCEPALW